MIKAKLQKEAIYEVVLEHDLYDIKLTSKIVESLYLNHKFVDDTSICPVESKIWIIATSRQQAQERKKMIVNTIKDTIENMNE